MWVVGNQIGDQSRRAQDLLERHRVRGQWAPFVINETESATHNVQTVGDGRERPEIGVVEETDVYIVYRLLVDYGAGLGYADPIYKDTEMLVKVDKRMDLPLEIRLFNEGGMEDLGAELYIDEPEFMAAMEGSTYSFLCEIEFSEYGSDFDIGIPREALDVKP